MYTAHTPEEAAAILAQIYGAGYPDKVILQDMIPGDDSFMHVLTAYVDKNHAVKMMCLGHVGLEEHTPRALGNHAAIITEYNAPLMEKLKAFLEAIEYTGFANFDIKYDTRDGSYRVFEINLRQGRSNYYVTGAGYNIARYVVEDRVLGRELGPCVMNRKEAFWHSVPRAVVYRYVKDKAFCGKGQTACERGQGNHQLRLCKRPCYEPETLCLLPCAYAALFQKNSKHTAGEAAPAGFGKGGAGPLNKTPRVLGILGGFGPMASVYFTSFSQHTKARARSGITSTSSSTPRYHAGTARPIFLGKAQKTPLILWRRTRTAL